MIRGLVAYLTSLWLVLDGRSGKLSCASQVLWGVDGLKMARIATLGRVYQFSVKYMVDGTFKGIHNSLCIFHIVL